MIPFEDLGCTPQHRADFEGVCQELAVQGKACQLGRVVSLDRGYPLVRTERDEARAELATSIKKSADSIVAVGDWVALSQPEGHEKAIIEAVLPRANEIARVKRVGRERQPRRQVLAANVDTVLICQSLTGQGVDLRLLVRQMAAVAGCDATPVFVLTKGDLVGEDETGSWCEQVSRIAPDVQLVVMAAGDGEALSRVRALCAPGTTSMLLGESGVGKSSLVNALIGTDSEDVGAVRASDDRGRHTTVARRMLQVPAGGLIIDAPGLRTLQILDMERSLQAAFPDIAELSCGCRFRDCTHTSEPGCAVRDSVAPERLAAYRYLADSDWKARS